MKKSYLQPETANIIFTAGCLDPTGDPASVSGDFNDAPARRGSIVDGPAGL